MKSGIKCGVVLAIAGLLVIGAGYLGVSLTREEAVEYAEQGVEIFGGITEETPDGSA